MVFNTTCVYLGTCTSLACVVIDAKPRAGRHGIASIAPAGRAEHGHPFVDWGSVEPYAAPDRPYGLYVRLYGIVGGV